jgi:hypothetical protein
VKGFLKNLSRLPDRMAGSVARVNPRPVFVLGNQKCGTTAIGALLAEISGSTVALDLTREIADPRYPLVLSGEMSLDRFISRNRLDFSRDVVKANSLTLFHPLLAERFPEARFAFVQRDPRDNIRSLLNRLDLPGNRRVIEEERIAALPAGWRKILTGSWRGEDRRDVVEVLAERWSLFADAYLSARKPMVLLRFEDFLADKVGAIRGLAERLGLDATRDIRHRVDHQFQPRGNRSVSRVEFFGEANLSRIEEICGDRMAEFGYDRTSRPVPSLGR